MAKARRSTASTASTATRRPSTRVHNEAVTTDVAVARPNVPVRARKAAAAPAHASGFASFWKTLVSSWLPFAIITGLAYAAVAYGFTTEPEYVRSKPLMGVFKRAFIALVVLSSRSQLADLYVPPTKTKTVKLLFYGHVKALLVVILANCAGTTVIQPLFGQPPAYAKTIELVIPTYFAVEAAIGLFSIPTPVIQFVIGFLVSWLKAATTSTLVEKWQEDEGAHPVAFVLICTCNLYASGLVLRFIAHYHKTRRVVALSFGLIFSLAKTFGVSALVGLLAYVANHFSTKEERQLEATALYFAVAWYALDKYWKPSLRSALVYLLIATPAKPKSL